MWFYRGPNLSIFCFDLDLVYGQWLPCRGLQSSKEKNGNRMLEIRINTVIAVSTRTSSRMKGGGIGLLFLFWLELKGRKSTFSMKLYFTEYLGTENMFNTLSHFGTWGLIGRPSERLDECLVSHNN